jgi:GT2 family glycosyltransferase
MVKQCIDSILQHTTYINYEIVLLDNQSTEESLEKLIEHYRNKLQSAFIHVKADFSFNFSKLINLGAAHATGNYYILLNNDTSVITSDWIERMLAKFSIPKTGAVGAKLLYPDNSIQHAGIVLQENTISRHINLGEKPDNELVSYNRNYLALTAACMMVSREAFNHVKGFDQSLAVNYNDIDFCIRLYKDSYHNVYAADVCLYHFESASRQHPFANWRSGKNFRIESAIMREKWFSLIADDPYYSKYQSMFTS